MVPKKLQLLNAQPRAAQGCLGPKEAQPCMHTPAHHRAAWVGWRVFRTHLRRHAHHELYDLRPDDGHRRQVLRPRARPAYQVLPFTHVVRVGMIVCSQPVPSEQQAASTGSNVPVHAS